MMIKPEVTEGTKGAGVEILEDMEFGNDEIWGRKESQ